MTRKNRNWPILYTCSIFWICVCVCVCVCARAEGLRQGLEDEYAYQHMWAQCRSTAPGHWARPHTWWRWSHATCSLDCIQTVPPCRCQSRSLSASQTGAQGLSYTEWHLSGGQLGIRGEGVSMRGRKTKRGGGCGRQKDNREKERWQDKGGREKWQSPCESPRTSLVTLICCARIGCLTPHHPALISHAWPQPMALCSTVLYELSAKLKNLFFKSKKNALHAPNQFTHQNSGGVSEKN